MIILIKGAGEMASAVGRRLHRAGFKVVMTELREPVCVRRLVSFAQAVFDGSTTVEDLEAVLMADSSELERAFSAGRLPVLIDSEGTLAARLKPEILVDGRMLKQHRTTSVTEATVVIGLGPGFQAGVDCHAVVETNRGHNLGRVLYQGSADRNSGIPAPVLGHGADRVLRAPATGAFQALRQIADVVQKGDVLGRISGRTVSAQIDGVIRGLLRDGITIEEGAKVGDIDPRGDPLLCRMISDKANAIAGGVLEACLYFGRQKGLFHL